MRSELPSESTNDVESWEWTEEEETILRHKIDWHTVPWITVLYLLCVHDPQLTEMASTDMLMGICFDHSSSTESTSETHASRACSKT